MQQLTNERNNAFLPGELGVRMVRACQPTTKPKAPHFFRLWINTNVYTILPGEPA